MSMKDRFPSNYQQYVGMKARDMLHENSKELSRILLDHNIIQDNIKIFEIGAGGCRNLKYIHDINSTVQLSANDLHKSHSLAQTHDSIKDKVNFIGIPTQDLKPQTDLDLLISSDHLMHVEDEFVKDILVSIRDDWKPKYVLLREVKKEREGGHRIWHDYSVLETEYEVIHSQDSKQDAGYFIKLLRRK